MMLPTEQVGSIPRPAALIQGIQSFEAGRISQPELTALYLSAVKDTIQRLEANGSPVITDGEQAEHSFATHSIYGHIRTLRRITAGPFTYKTTADVYLEIAQQYAHVPVKQAVISPSALSLMYTEKILHYSREEFIFPLFTLR